MSRTKRNTFKSGKHRYDLPPLTPPSAAPPPPHLHIVKTEDRDLLTEAAGPVPDPSPKPVELYSCERSAELLGITLRQLYTDVRAGRLSYHDQLVNNKRVLPSTEVYRYKAVIDENGGRVTRNLSSNWKRGDWVTPTCSKTHGSHLIRGNPYRVMATGPRGGWVSLVGEHGQRVMARGSRVERIDPPAIDPTPRLKSEPRMPVTVREAPAPAAPSLWRRIVNLLWPF